MDWKEKILSRARNAIAVEIQGAGEESLGTRFGGRPAVPEDFVWPVYEGESWDGEAYVGPLSFLAQFRCADLAPLDPEHLLPDHGLLSFFYDLNVQPWGFSPEHAGGARVFWFEDEAALSLRDLPEELGEDFRPPALGISLSRERSLPGLDEVLTWEEQQKVSWKDYASLRREQNVRDTEPCFRLLGWPDTIQGSMFGQCEMLARGYDMGSADEELRKIFQKVAETAPEKWRLLFQADTLETDRFRMMFGDCGRLFFCIPEEDLAARRFDRVRAVLQCS